MGRLVSVTFRGEELDVEIEHDGGYESDTNAHVIEWHFYRMTAEHHEALKITETEEQAIYEQLVEASRDYPDEADL